MLAEDFEIFGQDDYEYTEAYAGNTVMYRIWRYIRPGFSAWCTRAISDHKIIADSPYVDTFDEALAFANTIRADIEAGSYDDIIFG